MGFSSSWDGTLSSTEFCIAATALSEKWEQFNPKFPPWKWVSCQKPFWVTSHEVQGYLSLENFCSSTPNEERYNDQSNSFEEEPTDDATLDQAYVQEIHHYDLHIVYSTSYRVPILYFRGYHSDGQPLAMDDVEKDLPANALKTLRESKWTFMTQEEHPYLNRPWYTLHPCGTSEWMRLLFTSASATKDKALIQHYLVSWLSVVGQVVGLRVPLEMLNNSHLFSSIPSSDH